MFAEIISEDGLQLPERWAQLRPEQLKPEQFLSLTKDLYGPAAPPPAALRILIALPASLAREDSAAR